MGWSLSFDAASNSRFNLLHCSCPDDAFALGEGLSGLLQLMRLGAWPSKTAAHNANLCLELPSRRYCWRGVPASPALRTRLDDRYRAAAWRSAHSRNAAPHNRAPAITSMSNGRYPTQNLAVPKSR